MTIPKRNGRDVKPESAWSMMWGILRYVVVLLLLCALVQESRAETLGYSHCLDKADRVLHAQRTINLNYPSRDDVINQYWKLSRAGRSSAAVEWMFAAGRVGVPKAELKEQTMVACLEGDL